MIGLPHQRRKMLGAPEHKLKLAPLDSVFEIKAQSCEFVIAGVTFTGKARQVHDYSMYSRPQIGD